jgi:hypothetical protein
MCSAATAGGTDAPDVQGLGDPPGCLGHGVLSIYCHLFLGLSGFGHWRRSNAGFFTAKRCKMLRQKTCCLAAIEGPVGFASAAI